MQVFSLLFEQAADMAKAGVVRAIQTYSQVNGIDSATAHTASTMASTAISAMRDGARVGVTYVAEAVAERFGAKGRVLRLKRLREEALRFRASASTLTLDQRLFAATQRCKQTQPDAMAEKCKVKLNSDSEKWLLRWVYTHYYGVSYSREKRTFQMPDAESGESDEEEEEEEEEDEEEADEAAEGGDDANGNAAQAALNKRARAIEKRLASIDYSTRSKFLFFPIWQDHGDVVFLTYAEDTRCLALTCQLSTSLTSLTAAISADLHARRSTNESTKRKRVELGAKTNSGTSTTDPDAKRLRYMHDEDVPMLDADAVPYAPSVAEGNTPPRLIVKLHEAWAKVQGRRSTAAVGVPIDTRWHLGAMVFANRDAYAHRLQRFVRAKKSLVPYDSSKLGVLLHGTFGTGKSLLVTATANAIGAHVAIVVPDEFTRQSFREATDWAVKNNYILVLDEFDLLMDTLNDRSRSAALERTERRLAELKTLMTETRGGGSSAADGGDDDRHANAKKAYYEALELSQKQPIDLAFMQTWMDGEGPSDGRLIMASTNFPDRIPLALQRAGRFDVRLELTFFSADEIRQMLRKIYALTLERRGPVESAWLDAQPFPSGQWSGAELINVHRTHGRLRETARALLLGPPMQQPKVQTPQTPQPAEGAMEVEGESESDANARRAKADVDTTRVNVFASAPPLLVEKLVTRRSSRRRSPSPNGSDDDDEHMPDQH
jgi:hypothetical protein